MSLLLIQDTDVFTNSNFSSLVKTLLSVFFRTLDIVLYLFRKINSENIRILYGKNGAQYINRFNVNNEKEL